MSTTIQHAQLSLVAGLTPDLQAALQAGIILSGGVVASDTDDTGTVAEPTWDNMAEAAGKYKGDNHASASTGVGMGRAARFAEQAPLVPRSIDYKMAEVDDILKHLGGVPSTKAEQKKADALQLIRKTYDFIVLKPGTDGTDVLDIDMQQTQVLAQKLAGRTGPVLRIQLERGTAYSPTVNGVPTELNVIPSAQFGEKKVSTVQVEGVDIFVRGGSAETMDSALRALWIKLSEEQKRFVAYVAMQEGLVIDVSMPETQINDILDKVEVLLTAVMNDQLNRTQKTHKANYNKCVEADDDDTFKLSITNYLKKGPHALSSQIAQTQLTLLETSEYYRNGGYSYNSRLQPLLEILETRFTVQQVVTIAQKLGVANEMTIYGAPHQYVCMELIRAVLRHGTLHKLLDAIVEAGAGKYAIRSELPRSSTSTALLALQNFLLIAFNSSELRRFLRYDFGDIVLNLPGEGASHADLVSVVVGLLEQNNHTKSSKLYQKLLAERPGRRQEIVAMALQFGVNV